MALYINRVTLLGNLGQDPTVLTGPNYTLYTFSVATQRSYRDSNTGEWISNTDWVRCSLFINPQSPQNLVNTVQRLHKGAFVFVEGSLRTRKYTEQQTNTERTTLDVQVDTLNIVERPTSGNQAGYGFAGQGNNNFAGQGQAFAQGNGFNNQNNFANNQAGGNNFSSKGFNQNANANWGGNKEQEAVSSWNNQASPYESKPETATTFQKPAGKTPSPSSSSEVDDDSIPF